MADTSTSHVVLPDSQRAKSATVSAVRPVDPSLDIDITLKLRRKRSLPEIGKGIPQILDAKDLAENYGASADDISLVQKTLAEYGLKTLSSSPETRSIRLIGKTADLERAFQTKLFEFEGSGESHRGRTGSLYIPAALNGIVQGVFGLDDRRAASKRLPSQTSQPTALFGADLSKLYSFPPGNGNGQTIALFEFGGGFFPNDLAKFWSLSPNSSSPIPNIVPISVDGTSTSARDGQQDEVLLDIEVVASTLPNATINVYFGNFDEQGWIDLIDRVLQDKPVVASNSWGSAEDSTGWTSGAVQAINDALQQAALSGLTVAVASGDDGSDDQVGDGLVHVDFPASSPFVLAVGGTEFTLSNGSITNEQVWKDGDGLRNDGGGSSGGGVSTVLPRPTWQTVTVASVNPNPIDGRVVPDVSALAGFPGYVLVVDGKVSGNGGTSAATPLWASLVALLANNLTRGGIQLPFLTPLLYQSSGASTVGSLGTNDITTGDNITAKIGGYQAGAGYDAVTGWGSPNGAKLLDALQSSLARTK